MSRPSHVVVCGAGVVGCSVALYLARRGIKVHLIDKTGVAAAASGSAGGFLARDWCDGTPQEELARLSFDLHQELASDLDGSRWQYRRLDTLSASLPSGARGLVAHHDTKNQWLADGCFSRGVIGTPSTTAQVDPERFTKALFEAAQRSGATFEIANVTGVLLDEERQFLSGVETSSGHVLSRHVIFTMGPWSCELEGCMPIASIDSIKSDSVLLKPAHPLPATALFVDVETSSGSWEALEIFPRADGTVYVCGVSDDDVLPEAAEAVTPRSGSSHELRSLAGRAVSALADAKIVRSSACHRPVTESGLPVIGQVPGLRGAFIAAGHGPWGILNAPATGLALSELIVDGAARSLDLDVFAGKPLANNDALVTAVAARFDENLDEPAGLGTP